MLKIFCFILALLWITVAFLRAGEMLPVDQTMWTLDAILLAIFSLMIASLEGRRRER